MKTIVFFNSELAWGGGEKWHLEMSYYLHLKESYNVIVYCEVEGELYKKVVEKKIKVRPVSVSNLSFFNLPKLAMLTSFLKRDQPDLIVLNISKDIKIGGLAAKLARVKNIVYRRGSAIPIKNTILNRWYFKNIITDILVNSNETKKTINQKNSKLFPKDKIKVIYNGLHLEEYYSKEKKDSTCFVIGNLGRLEYQKNQTALLDLAVVLKQNTSGFRILIGGDGRLMDELKQKARALEVEDVVEFKGYVNDVNNFMSQIDVFVLPSHWEGFGYVLAEASYHEKPVVAYDVSSNPEIITNNKTGFLIEKDNILKMAQCLIELKGNELLRKNIGTEGKRFVEKHFDAKANQGEVEGYFRELIDYEKNTEVKLKEEKELEIGMRKRELKVLIDLERLRYPNSGIANVFKNLAIGLSEVGLSKRQSVSLFGPIVPIKSLKTGCQFIKRKSFHKLIPFYGKRFNVLHVSHQLSSYFHIKLFGQKKVITLHDLNFLHENISEKKCKKQQHKVKKNLKNADVVVCISEFTKQDFLRNIGLFSFKNQPKLKVIYNGLRFPEVDLNYDFGGYSFLKKKKYILNIGVLFPKKNQLSLVKMLPHIKEDLVLVVSDENKLYKQEVLTEIDKLGVKERVHFCYNISDEQKWAIINGCTSMCHPSMAEGFGIPVIEAMHFKKPIFISNLTSLPEIGGNVAFYFNNFKTSHMLSVYGIGMERYYRNKEEFEKKLTRRAKVFDYKIMAKKYLEVYEEIF